MRWTEILCMDEFPYDVMPTKVLLESGPLHLTTLILSPKHREEILPIPIESKNNPKLVHVKQ